MSLELVYYGNPVLASVAENVSNVDGSISSIVDEMFRVMYKEKGIGLAAPQVNLGRRIIVVDPGDNRSRKIALINPVIAEFSDRTEPYEEGCLSLPGLNADVIRPSEIFVKALNANGDEIEFEAGGILARVIQHEVDHLNGIVFIDRIEKYVRDEFRSELKKIKKLNTK